jgi:hypothetical protein
MLRVLKADGLILWYHIDNPWNFGIRRLRKPEIAQLLLECRIGLHRVTVAAPLSRFLARYSRLVCYILEKLRILNAHYLGVIHRA